MTIMGMCLPVPAQKAFHLRGKYGWNDYKKVSIKQSVSKKGIRNSLKKQTGVVAVI